MTIGVAAVLAMIAIGTGAESAIEDQIRAAGMNLIVVTAGNYKVKATDDFGGGAVEPSAGLRRRDDVAQGFEETHDNRRDRGDRRENLEYSLRSLRPQRLTARGESLASHRDGRGAPMARRDDREYREYVSGEQRSQPGVLNAGAALGWSGDASPVECSQTFVAGC